MCRYRVNAKRHNTYGGRGPALGGLDLVYYDVFDQIALFSRLPTARSVHRAKALRSPIELAIAHGTTKSFSEYNDVVDLQLKKTAAFLELQVDVRCSVVCSCMESCSMLNRCAPADRRDDYHVCEYHPAALPSLSRPSPPVSSATAHMFCWALHVCSQ